MQCQHPLPPHATALDSMDCGTNCSHSQRNTPVGGTGKGSPQALARQNPGTHCTQTYGPRCRGKGKQSRSVQPGSMRSLQAEATMGASPSYTRTQSTAQHSTRKQPQTQRQDFLILRQHPICNTGEMSDSNTDHKLWICIHTNTRPCCPPRRAAAPCGAPITFRLYPFCLGAQGASRNCTLAARLVHLAPVTCSWEPCKLHK
jgi:hypothetical protein